MYDELRQGLAWMTTNWLGIVGLLVGVISIILCWINRGKSYRLCFQRSTLMLIGGALPSEVKVLVGGDAAPRLALTTLVLWNSGSRALRRDSVVGPIKVAFNRGDRIFRHRILSVSRRENESSATRENEYTLVLDFLYLDRHDGMAIEILHDSESLLPEIRGTIIENKRGFGDEGEVSVGRFNGTRVVMSLVTSLFLGVIGGTVWVTGDYRYSILGIVVGVAGCSWALQIVSKAWKNRRKCPKSLARRVGQ